MAEICDAFRWMGRHLVDKIVKPPSDITTKENPKFWNGSFKKYYVVVISMDGKEHWNSRKNSHFLVQILKFF
jgi:hypothetical protein